MQSIEDKILSSIKKCRIVPRYSKADVSYASMPDGRRLSETVEGYVAIIFQHECDHLDGILYTDRADTSFCLPVLGRRAFRLRGFACLWQSHPSLSFGISSLRSDIPFSSPEGPCKA